MNFNTSELFKAMEDLLVDIELLPSGDKSQLEGDMAAFQAGILAIRIHKEYNKDYPHSLSVQLNQDGYALFMKHVRERAEHIGFEFKEPIPVTHSTTLDSLTFSVTPWLEFMTLVEKGVTL